MIHALGKRILVLLLIVSLGICLTGCYDTREVDDLAYAMALGLDEGKTNRLQITLQFAIPVASAAEKGGGDIEKAVNVITIECPTFYTGIKMINNFVAKQVNLSHCKVLVISDKLARKGAASPYILQMVRGREFRPNMNVVVTRGPVRDFIKEVKPAMEINPAKYFELNLRSGRYTGMNSKVSLQEFVAKAGSDLINPIAMLGGVNKNTEPEEFTNENSTFREKGRTLPDEGDYKAGDLPKKSGTGSEILGLAVFRGVNMVGELDGEETMGYLMASGEFNNAYINVPDPEETDKFIVLNIRQSRKPIHQVSMKDGKPVIHLRLNLEADYLAIQSGIHYEDPANTPKVENAASKMITRNISRLLEKTAKEFNSDIIGFGAKMKRRFLTQQDWEAFKWLDRYKYATFDVKVDVKIRRTGLVIQSPEAVK